MAKLNRYHTEVGARYLQKLREIPDGDGSLFDHMTILYGAGISNSTRHSSVDLPLVVLGGGNGRLNGGPHRSYADSPPMASLHDPLRDKMDVPVEKVGGSTGQLQIDTLGEV